MKNSPEPHEEPTTPGPRVVIIGGGPGGYEAALVADQLGALVTIVEAVAIGGNAVLTDVVPSKTLIATAEVMNVVRHSPRLGVRFAGGGSSVMSPEGSVRVDIDVVNRRLLALAKAQSRDIGQRLEREGVRFIAGRGRLLSPEQVEVTGTDGTTQTLDADVVLLSTGAHPRELDTARPDGERILSWTQLYGLKQLPERLIVVGSGVTGAEFASAYRSLGSEVVLVSSRDQVLPGHDKDAAQVIEEVFKAAGLEVRSRSRAESVTVVNDGVEVTLSDGSVIKGSHCLMAVGSIPNTDDLGLEQAGVRTTDSGHIEVDRVSRTSARGVYAAGDCTGVLPLASVAAMQGRIAMWHALGDAVTPLDLRTASSNIFTDPEIAYVGASQEDVESGKVTGTVVTLPLAGNARAKMQGISDGFVKLFCSNTGIVLGGVVVSPRASELIHPVTLAVDARLSVDQVAHAFTIYPSLSGSVAEAARRLHRHGVEE